MLAYIEHMFLFLTCGIVCGTNIEKDLGLIMTLKNTTFTEDLFILPLDSKINPISGSIRPYRCPVEALFTSVAGDYTLHYAYVYDYYSHTIYRDANFSIDFPGNDVMMIFHRGLSSDYVNLAVDWISHNIYWTDPSYKWIMVKSLKSIDMSKYRVLIHENLDGPRALALDPMEGLLFWSDIGTWSKIEVSSLSGRNRRTLISSKLIYPYSLAADYAARRLFLYDSGRKSLESFTYEGKDRKTFLRDENADIFGIAVYKNGLYVTDKSKFAYLIVDKTSGGLLFERPTINVLGVSLFRPDDTFKSSTAPCINHRCQHMCLAEKDGAICHCNDGYTLDEVKQTCSLRTEYFHRGLMFSTDSRICVADIRAVTDFTFNPKCEIYFTGITHMVMDTDGRRLILAKEMSIYTASVDKPSFFFLVKANGMISGLAWDGYDRDVYWTERNPGKILRKKTDRDPQHVFYEGLTNPRDIIVLSHERLVYWISDRNGYTVIESSNIDGSNHNIVMDSTTVLNPKSLNYDQYTKRIFFLDTFGKDQTHIRSFKLDGSNLKTFGLSNKNLDLLEIYKGHLLVTANDVNGTLITLYSIRTGEEKTSGIFPSTGKISSIKIFDENIRQNVAGPCFHSNGECEDICIPQGKNRVCDCRFGFRLTWNGKNCTSDPDVLEFMLVVDSTDNTVYQINFVPQTLEGIDITSGESLSGITYSPFDDVLIFGATSALYITHLNGTIKSIFPVPPSDDVVYTPNRFAVDYSTGNIYYTVTNNQRFNKADGSYIGVISPNKKQRRFVIGLIDPSGLVVYPSKGLMFYSEGALSPCLGKANMDGSQWSILLTLPQENPTDLTIDYKSDNLYYIDSLRHSVKYCKIDGTGHNTLIDSSSDSSILAAIVYNHHLFISTTRNSSIIKVDISNPSVRETFAHYGELGKISFISMFSNSNLNKNSFCSYDNGGCSTFCFPIPGIGICGCEDGLELMDGSDKVCSNMKDRVFIMTSGSTSCKENIYIQRIGSDGIPVQRYIYPYSCTGEVQFTGIAGDFVLQQTYMYDYYSRSIYRDASFSIHSSGNNVMNMFHKGLSRHHVNLAVDWISHNIYWTDPSYRWIIVKSLESNDMSMYRVLIHENLEDPRALALDPMEGLLFWSDIGTRTKIEVSSLSGKNRKTLLSSKLSFPVSLAADYAARRLFLYDSGRQTLETFTYEGKDRKTVFKNDNTVIFTIAVYKKFVYMTDRSSKRFRVVDKTDGYSLHTENIDQPFLGLTMFHPDVTSSSSTADCISHGCEHICVAEKDVATCLCKDGYTLNQDTTTCSLRTEHFHRGLMFSNESSICIADIRVVTDLSFDATCFMSVVGTTHMVLDTDQRRMILVIGMSIYWAVVDNPTLHLLTEAHGKISGLAWDGYERSVYWTEEDTGVIWRHTTEADISHVFLKDLKKPRDIIVLSHERLVYWISDRDGTTIECSNSDGSNLHIVLGSDKVVDPRSLNYDQYTKRIYFLDMIVEGKSKIRSFELDGSNLRPFGVTFYDMLVIYKGHLLVTANDAKGTLITSYSITSKRETTSGLMSGTGKMSAIKIFDENIRQSETGPCFNYNGECEDICIPNGKTRVCDCRFGFRLTDNGKNCTSDASTFVQTDGRRRHIIKLTLKYPIKDNFMLVVDSSDNTVYQISLQDQSLQGIGVKLTDSLTGVTYSPVDNVIIFGAASKLVISYLNGTIKAVFPVSQSDDVVRTPNRFAVDYSTGNIYYTANINNRFFPKNQSYISVLSPSGKMRTLVFGLNDPSGLAVYPSKGLLFYSEGFPMSYIGQATMDGGQSSILLKLSNEYPIEITIDYKSEYLYYIDSLTQRVKYCKVDGTGHNTFIKYSGTRIAAAFPYQDNMFISTTSDRYISKTNIDLLKLSKPFSQHDELGTVRFINIYSSSNEDKNEFCSIANGGCSTFCFPIPEFGICGCEDGVQLSEGSDNVCSNIEQP